MGGASWSNFNLKSLNEEFYYLNLMTVKLNKNIYNKIKRPRIVVLLSIRGLNITYLILFIYHIYFY